MKKISCLLLIFALFPTLLFAFEDHGENESVFVNNTDGTIYCLGDRNGSPGVICMNSAEPGQTCIGDASTDKYPEEDIVDVVKMPNGCEYSIVDETDGDKNNFYASCGQGTYWYTRCVMCVRRLQTGQLHHGRMNLDYFCNIMGGKDIVKCNSDGTTIQPVEVIYECPEQKTNNPDGLTPQN